VRRLGPAVVDRLVAAAIFFVALLPRSQQVGAPPYGDEAGHFTVSQLLASTTSRVVSLYGGHVDDYSHFFWQRPLHFLIMWSGARFGFTGFRVEAILLASLIPALLYLLLRRCDVRPLIAGGFGLLVAIYPGMASWGGRGFSDPIACLALLLSVWFQLGRRHYVASMFAVAACWIKEVCIIAAAFLALAHLLERTRGVPLLARRLDRTDLPYLVAPFLGVFPLVFSTWLGARPPGWTTGGSLATAAETVFITPWFLPLLGLAFVRHARHPLTIMGLGMPCYYVAEHVVRGLMIQAWYLQIPFTMLCGASALGLETAWRMVAVKSWQRRAKVAITLLLVLVFAIPITLPGGTQTRAVFSPVAGSDGHDLPQALYFARLEGADAKDAGLAVQELHPERVLLIDVGWFYHDYPFARGASSVANYVWTEALVKDRNDLALLNRTVQDPSTVTVIERHGDAASLNARLIHTYAACVAHENGGYVIFRGDGCRAS
jgi:hypothetical protein